jgi:hypothetical protein
VTDYRIDLIGSDGHFESSRTFVCDTDEERYRVGKADGGPAARGALERDAAGGTPVPSCRKTGRQP